MALNLKLLFKDQRLKLGAKAFALALSAIVLPFGVALFGYLIFALAPFIFPVSLLGVGIISLFAIRLFFVSFGWLYGVIFASSLTTLFLLARDKNILNKDRYLISIAVLSLVIIFKNILRGDINFLWAPFAMLVLISEYLSFIEVFRKRLMTIAITLAVSQILWVIKIIGLNIYIATSSLIAFLVMSLLLAKDYEEKRLISKNILFNFIFVLAIITLLSLLNIFYF